MTSLVGKVQLLDLLDFSVKEEKIWLGKDDEPWVRPPPHPAPFRLNSYAKSRRCQDSFLWDL
jgi:hypothetical protein